MYVDSADSDRQRSTLLVHPRHRTRVTIVSDDDNRTRKVLEVCDDWVSESVWHEWIRGTEVCAFPPFSCVS